VVHAFCALNLRRFVTGMLSRRNSNSGPAD
jgi:hypothetical protein